MLLCNFTPDDVEWQHGGIFGTLKSGEIEEFADNRANFIANKWGPRGILRWTLDSDEEAVRAKAMKIYKGFWNRQITNFNQHNEANKNERKPYVFPPEQLVGKAEEMGIELIAPYKVNPATESAQVSELKAKNKELESKFDFAMEKLDEMTKLVRELGKKPVVGVPVDTADLIKSFITLDKAKFKGWVMKNAEDILGWPKQARDRAIEKWDSFYPDVDWPLSDEGDADGDVS